MENELVTFEIKTKDLPAFKNEFAKLCRKAAKLKVEAPTYQIQGEKIVPGGEFIRQNEDGQPETFYKTGYVATIVTVSGPAPKLAGWTFVATLQHEESGNIVRRVPGTESINVAVDMRTVAPYCNHCRTQRRRNDTYVVAHDDGRQAQVGRQCLRDFTGHDSPEAIARWAELLSAFVSSVGDSYGEGEGYGSGGELCCLVEDYLAYVVVSIRENGWISRTKERNTGVPATANSAWNLRFPSKEELRRCHDKGLTWPAPTDADKARAARAIEVAVGFFESEEAAGRSLEDYTHNLRIAVECRTVTYRSAGIVASLVSFAERLIGAEIERKNAAVSEYQGTVGKRSEFSLIVTKVISIESMYGVSSLHLMQDAVGNRFTWKASREQLDVGSTYQIKGTIKEHRDYNGIKQTVLSRCAATKT